MTRPPIPRPLPDPLAAARQLRDAPLRSALAALRRLHARRESREQRRDPEAPSGRGPSYDAARRRFYESAERDARFRALAGDVAAQLLPGRPDPDDAVGLALRGIQEQVLAHPAAMHALLRALAAEGRRFAETPEGRRWRRRLEGSELVQRARLVFQIASLSALEPAAGDAGIPSSYLDGLFLAAAGDPDRVLDRLFGGCDPPEEEPAP